MHCRPGGSWVARLSADAILSWYRIKLLEQNYLSRETSETPLEGLIRSDVFESCCVFRRAIYEKTSGWNEYLGQGRERMDLYIQFALFSDIHFVPQHLYKYRQHPTQTHKRGEEAELQIQKLIAKWKNEKELTSAQKAKLFKMLWFYQRRLVPLMDAIAATNYLRGGKFGTALNLYLKSAKFYFMSFFPFPL